MNQKYWNDLTAEGRELTRVAAGEARDLKMPPHVEHRAAVRKLADTYRSSVRDTHYRDPICVIRVGLKSTLTPH